MQKLAHPALFLLLALILVGCVAGPDNVSKAGDTETASPALGTLVGAVTIGPLSPMVRPGATGAPAGVADAQITISPAAGGAPLTAVTGPDGRYSIGLPPGAYMVTMPSLHGAMFSRDLPGTVTIVSGQQTRFDIHLDTGIR